jgi:hypothetical protein
MQPNQVYKLIPPLPDDFVGNAKIALRTVLTQRPDIVAAAKDLFSDPQIRPVLQDIFGIASPPGPPSPNPFSTTMLKPQTLPQTF